MDITPLFKACIKSVRLQNKQLPVPDKNRILKNSQKDELSKKSKEIRYQITQLRNFLVENRAAYMQFACHLKRSAQMTNEERDIIDREAEKIINICTQFICELKIEYGSRNLTKQQRVHVDTVLELLANYLKAVYNIFNDQKNYRIRRDLETYRFLKLNADHRRDNIDMSKVEYKEHMDLNTIKNSDNENSADDDDEQPILSKKAKENSDHDDVEEEEEDFENYEEETRLLRRKNAKNKRNIESENNTKNQYIEDDTNQQYNDYNYGLSAEDLQMLEIENKQMLSQFQGLNEEVQQIEKHVYDIAKLQEIFTEKVVLQKADIERISNSVVGATENVREANEQIKEATQRNAGLRVYVLFFLLVMSFSLLFLDWYND